jgi:single-strand DNA-binding protein
MNIAIVQGLLTSPPRERTLASGDTLISYEIRSVEADESKLTVPVSWISPSRPPAVDVGDEVVAIGVVRRRFFRAGGATQSRTEIAAELVARPGSKRVRQAMRRAVEPVVNVA